MNSMSIDGEPSNPANQALIMHPNDSGVECLAANDSIHDKENRKDDSDHIMIDTSQDSNYHCSYSIDLGDDWSWRRSHDEALDVVYHPRMDRPPHIKIRRPRRPRQQQPALNSQQKPEWRSCVTIGAIILAVAIAIALGIYFGTHITSPYPKVTYYLPYTGFDGSIDDRSLTVSDDYIVVTASTAKTRYLFAWPRTNSEKARVWDSPYNRTDIYQRTPLPSVFFSPRTLGLAGTPTQLLLSLGRDLDSIDVFELPSPILGRPETLNFTSYRFTNKSVVLAAGYGVSFDSPGIGALDLIYTVAKSPIPPSTIAYLQSFNTSNPTTLAASVRVAGVDDLRSSNVDMGVSVLQVIRDPMSSKAIIFMLVRDRSTALVRQYDQQLNNLNQSFTLNDLPKFIPSFPDIRMGGLANHFHVGEDGKHLVAVFSNRQYVAVFDVFGQVMVDAWFYADAPVLQVVVHELSATVFVLLGNGVVERRDSTGRGGKKSSYSVPNAVAIAVRGRPTAALFVADKQSIKQFDL
ncbi:hypothetical protein BJ742DRAFT_346655 [Cladochytrium replicatum]|nr:hypothetical protein BJ742DRAFT_346655 [Cladochytrium replicatum]